MRPNLEVQEVSYNLEDVGAKHLDHDSTRSMMKASKELSGRLICITTLEEGKEKVVNFELFTSGPPERVKEIVMAIKSLFNDNNIN
jgi:hypothetical protein